MYGGGAHLPQVMLAAAGQHITSVWCGMALRAFSSCVESSRPTLAIVKLRFAMCTLAELHTRGMPGVITNDG